MAVVSTELAGTAPRLALYDWGGRGTPVVLAHATGFHGRVWAPVATRLVAHGHRVWSFDFRGHGDSDRSPDGYAWERFGDDVATVLDHLGLSGDRSLLAVGHSKGAAALLLAELARPGMVGRAWLYEPIVIPAEPGPPAPDFPLARGARRRRARWSSPDEARHAWGARPPLDALGPDSLAAYAEYGLRREADGTWSLKCDPEDEAAVYAHAPAHPLWPGLEKIRTDALVVCGEHSDAVPPPLGERLAARLPHGRLEVMAGRGHFGPLEDPDAAVASIAAFDARSAS